MLSLRFRFRGIKKTGDGALAQVDEADLFWQANPEVNSIAIIMRHLHGNMLSRWTDFLTTDGEKPWRDQDGEFEAYQINDATDLNWDVAPMFALKVEWDKIAERHRNA